MKVINLRGIKGYKISDIEKTLGKTDFIKFVKWLRGQTIMNYQKEDFIYQCDYWRFKKGLPVID